MSYFGPGRRVVIVDDSRTIQALLDNAFSKRNDFQVVGLASDATAAVAMIRRLMPDIVTIDLCMPYLDGAALLEMIGDLKSVCKIVVSDQPSKSMAMTTKLQQAGASACIGKSELVKDPHGFFKKVNAAADSIRNGRRSRWAAIGPIGASVDASVPLQALDRADPLRLTQATSSLGFPIPLDEAKRLRILHEKTLSNGVRERQFDLITKHAAKLTGFPVCLLTFIDQDTQWVKASYGLDVTSTPREQAFCNYTISQGGIFAVTNAAADDRFSDNPLVTGAPFIRSYMGHPITTADGVRVGALCVIDTRVRQMSKLVDDHLASLSEMVAEMIDLRPSKAA